MKSLFIFGMLALAGFASASYSGKFEDFDIDLVLNDRELLMKYIKCVLDKGPCDPQSQELKDTIAEALKDNCAKCTPKQTEILAKAVTHLIQHERKYWNQLLKKLDPEGNVPLLKSFGRR